MAFDYDALLQRCLGNVEFAERVLAKFRDRFGEDLRQLERGVESADAGQIARIAHRLKGASANVAAAGLRRHAAEIEEFGRVGRISEVPSCLARLRHEWTRFIGTASSLEPAAGASG
ncbi:MAG: Hpt domain-containing protein [Planctomycetota bacterium]